MKTIAIIPARGGSKRIPGKNVKPFAGAPMISYSIKAALLSNIFDDVIVSTDDPQIAEVAHEYGASVPFMRPPEISRDDTATPPVIQHAIKWYNEHIGPVGFACCLYATSPFTTSEDLVTGLDTLKKSDKSFSMSVCSYAYPIQRALKITADGALAMFDPAMMMVRSQMLEPAYHDAGQFYWGRASAWLESERIFDSATPVFIPRYRVMDIDTVEDWVQAELMFKAVGMLKAAA